MSINNIVSRIGLDSNSLALSGTNLRVQRSSSGFISDSGFYGAGLQLAPAVGGQLVSTAIVSSDFKQIHTTPYGLLLNANVSPSAILVVDSLFLYSLAGSTTAYTGGGNLVLQYGDTPGGVVATVPIPASTITSLTPTAEQFFGAPGIFSSVVAPQLISGAIGMDIYLYVDTANFATGDTDFGITFNYHFVYP